MCEHHSDRVAGIEPTEEEIYDYRACLDVPRSGVT